MHCSMMTSQNLKPVGFADLTASTALDAFPHSQPSRIANYSGKASALYMRQARQSPNLVKKFRPEMDAAGEKGAGLE